MEKVKDFVQDPEIFENEIEMYLQIFCERNGIQDMTKESQSRWNAALMFIRKQVFRDREAFRNHKLISNENNTINSTYNIYDIDLVNTVCDIYIYLCMIYDKEISILGFCSMTGIPDKTIYAWGYTERKLSPLSTEIFEKLMKYNEESLSDKLASGKSNPVGIIAMLNRKHGWASPYTADANRQRVQITTAEQLPQLGKKTVQSLSAADKEQPERERNTRCCGY